MDKAERSRLGRKSRAAGKRFEVKVRDDLEDKGWIVVRWNKNVEDNHLITSRGKFNPFTQRVQNMSSGFPDFLCIQLCFNGSWNIQLVECKLKGKLSRIEKDKMVWIHYNLGIRCFIASKDGKEIRYTTPMANS